MGRLNGAEASGSPVPTLRASANELTVYDATTGVTWLADANLAASNRFGLPVCEPAGTQPRVNPSGSMSYQSLVAWIHAMRAADYPSHADWQLPTTPNAEPRSSTACPRIGPKPYRNQFGFNCADNGLGSPFYNDLGLRAPNSAVPVPSNKVGPFTNFQPYLWSRTPGAGGHASFSFGNGFKGANTDHNFLYVLAILPGKIPGTPPATGNWLEVNDLHGRALGRERRRHQSPFEGTWRAPIITQPSRPAHIFLTPRGEDQLMNLNPTKATVIGLIAAAAMVPAFAPAVQAQTVLTPSPAQFQRAQEALEHQIIARQVQLVLLGTEVANAANVTTSDRSALVSIITDEQSALATDATNAAAATTDAELASVRSAVIGDERVYAVVTGQVGLVVAADNETVTEAGYTALITELTPFVTELGSAHATALLSDVTSQVTAATALTGPVSADALALTPAGYPGNASQIKTWTFQTGQAGHDLGVAKNDIKAIEDVALGLHRLPIAHRI